MLAALFAQLNNVAAAVADASPTSDASVEPAASPSASQDRSPVSLTGMTFDRRALGSRAENLARFMEEMNLQSLSSQQHSAQNTNQSAKGAAAPLAGTAERMSARDLSSSPAERASSLRDDRVSAELDPKLLGSSMPPRPAPLERRVDPSVEANGEHAVNEAELQHRLNGRTMGRRTS